MAKTKKVISFISMFAAFLLLIISTGCSKDETKSQSYKLNLKDVSGISGTVTFTENGSTGAIIDIALTGSSAALAGEHPAELCDSSAVEGGTVALELNPVDATGKSTTTETTLSYSTLIAYDGFIKVLKSSTESNKILAQGDIGGNVLTDNSKSYNLGAVGTVYGITGTAKFQKRVNDNTLLTITLSGNVADNVPYLATINYGRTTDAKNTWYVMKSLTDVVGVNGIGVSYTNIRQLDNGNKITYDDWLNYDGYLNIFTDSVAYSYIICQGAIGSN